MSANDERISNQSMDLGEFNKERLLEMFPIFRTEGGGVDFDRLKLALGESVEVGKEVFGMRWPGKADSIRLANAASHGTLSPDEKESVNFDTTQNLIIEGDNLDVLKLLQKSYQSKIKMIYIDPPYNTEKDFIYKDKYSDSLKTYLEVTGQVDEQGNRYATSSDTRGRIHRNWLNMIYPRLYLAKSLLSDDGILLIHIDEHESQNLKFVLNEIFGEENNLGDIIWDKRNPKGDATAIATQHETIYGFAKSVEHLKSVFEIKRRKANASKMIEKAEKVYEKVGKELIPEELKRFVSKYSIDLDLASHKKLFTIEDARSEFKLWLSSQSVSGGEAAYDQIDESGRVFQAVSMAWPNKKLAPDGYFKPLIHPRTKKPCPVPARGWRNPPETMAKLLDGDLIVFGEDETTQPRRKYLLSENMSENVPSVIPFGGSDDAMLNSLGIPFDNPKPVAFAMQLMEWFGTSDGIFMDFFAGSGTTAHAVMAQNTVDGGNRKFILVQFPEQVDPESEAAKAGFSNIAEITKERVRRAGKKIIEESDGKLKLEGEEALDFGFRVLKLNESNIEDWNSEEASKSPKDLLDALKTSRLKSGRSDQDVIFEVLVKYGIELTSSVEEQKVGKGSVWKIAGGEMIVVVSPGLTNADLSAIVKMTPKVVVMLDEAFVPEALKTNARATFKDAKIELKTF